MCLIYVFVQFYLKLSSHHQLFIEKYVLKQVFLYISIIVNNRGRFKHDNMLNLYIN